MAAVTATLEAYRRERTGGGVAKGRATSAPGPADDLDVEVRDSPRTRRGRGGDARGFSVGGPVPWPAVRVAAPRCDGQTALQELFEEWRIGRGASRAAEAARSRLVLTYSRYLLEALHGARCHY